MWLSMVVSRENKVALTPILPSNVAKGAFVLFEIYTREAAAQADESRGFEASS